MNYDAKQKKLAVLGVGCTFSEVYELLFEYLHWTPLTRVTMRSFCFSAQQ